MDAEIPGGAQGSSDGVFGGRGRSNVGHAHASPAAGDGEEEVRSFGEEVGLLLGEEDVVAVALGLVG